MRIETNFDTGYENFFGLLHVFFSTDKKNSIKSTKITFEKFNISLHL